MSDHVALGVLTRTFPPALVDEVRDTETGRAEQPSRLLPARLVVHYVLAMTLFSSAGHEEVMRNLTEGLAWADGWRRGPQVPSKSAIFQAWARLGVPPLEVLFGRACVPSGTPDTHRGRSTGVAVGQHRRHDHRRGRHSGQCRRVRPGRDAARGGQRVPAAAPRRARRVRDPRDLRRCDGVL